MPKMKTKTAAKKRFKRTATGKIMHKHTFSRHNMEHKSSKRRRSFRKDQLMSDPDTKKAEKLLGLR